MDILRIMARRTARHNLGQLAPALLLLASVAACEPGGVTAGVDVPACAETRVLALTGALLNQRAAVASAADVESLIAAARSRQTSWLQLLAADPEAALRASLSPALRATFPAAVQPLIEATPDVVTGRLQVTCLTRRGRGMELHYHLHAEDGTPPRQLFFAGDGPQELGGQPIFLDKPLQAQRGGDTVLLARPDQLRRAATPARQLNVAAAPTTLKALAILLTFRDAPQQLAPSLAQVEALTARVAEFNLVGSYGTVNTEWTVVGPYATDNDAGNPNPINANTWDLCNGTDMWSMGHAGLALATAAGYNTGAYDRVTFIIATSPHGCNGIAGIGEVPGRFVWLNAVELNNESAWLGDLVHEMGHNFGLSHASTIDCSGSKVDAVIGDNFTDCASRNEYGDYFDVMGMGNVPLYSSFNADRLGWIEAAGPGAIITPEVGGTFHLGPLASRNGDLKALRLAKNSSYFYYVEYRQPEAFASFLNGVFVRVAGTPSAGGNTVLLNMSGTSDYGIPWMRVGQVFHDGNAPAGGLTLTLLAADANGATLTVRFGNDPTPDLTATPEPTATSTPTPTPTPTPEPTSTPIPTPEPAQPPAAAPTGSQPSAPSVASPGPIAAPLLSCSRLAEAARASWR